MKLPRVYVLSLLCCIFLLAAPGNALAVSTTFYKIPQTLAVSDIGFKLEVPSNASSVMMKIDASVVENEKAPASEYYYVSKAVKLDAKSLSTLQKPVRLSFNFDEIDFKRASNLDTALSMGHFRIACWDATNQKWKQIPSEIFWNGTGGRVECESDIVSGLFALIWTNNSHDQLSKISDGSIRISCNLSIIQISTNPYIKAGRTMVPLGLIAENLGTHVYWDQAEKRIDLIGDDGRTVNLWIGQIYAQKNDETIRLDVSPEIVDGKTFVPLSFVAESLGAQVSWDGLTQTAYILKY